MFAVKRYLMGGAAGVEVRLLAGAGPAMAVAAKAKADRKDEASMLGEISSYNLVND